MVKRTKKATTPAPSPAAPAWPADAIERRSLAELIPYARNSRTHSDAQIAQIAASITEWGWTTPILVTEEGTIIAGHGRVLAARQLALDDVPVMVARGWTEAQVRAYVIADNKLALNAGWDLDMLRTELAELDDVGFELALTGFSSLEFADLMDGESAVAGGGDPYSRKIEAPIYEPKGDKPATSELFDDVKARQLVQEIRAAQLPKDVAAFLEAAAARHVVFNFSRIADFYASADAATQRLMERSALVIIDFDKAIEHGFVKLTTRLAELSDQAADDDDQG